MLASPENTRFRLPEPRLVVLVVLLLLAMESERRSIQGTTTCLPLPRVEEIAPSVVLGCDELVWEELVVLELAALPETDRIAKSILPELGLMITSLTLPRF